MPRELRERLGRLVAVGPTLLMVATGAGISWLIASHAVGHRGAFFAPVATVVALGLASGQRLQRAIELCVGVPLGIALADVLVLALGSGTLQLVAIVLVGTSLAVLVGGGAILVSQTAVSAILVVTLQPPTNGLSFTRAADALIGCGVALVLTFVVAPIDPLALARRQAEPVLDELAGVLADAAAALEARDRDAAIRALQRARAMDALSRRLLEALAVGRETAFAAPQRRAARGPLEVYAEAADQLDLAVRNVRVLARGVVRALDVGDRVPPELPRAMRRLGEAVACLTPWLVDLDRAPGAVDAAVEAAGHASAVLEQTTNLSVSVLVGQVRSTAVDLLRTTGMAAEDARALIRAGEG